MTNALMDTDAGQIHLVLFDADAPNTVANFVKLAKDGFYDGLAFHRVIPGFMAQGGCPNSREGARGMAGTGGTALGARGRACRAALRSEPAAGCVRRLTVRVGRPGTRSTTARTSRYRSSDTIRWRCPPPFSHPQRRSIESCSTS